MDKFELANRDEVVTNILEVKKSKFIAKVYYIYSQEIAEKIIQKARDEYKDARHVVYAYMLKSNGRFTDDKEPQGTAGKPIYSLLEKENLVNVLVIVVRYFGGILLGAGPLTRAYATVAKDALSLCEKIPYIEYDEKTLICEYKEEELSKRDLIKDNCIIKEIIRTDKVQIKYLKPKE
ncbi:MAG: YigZ family protein [Clostridia bacterium]|nr:YigZ family protein [Clostridia bacterium]